MKSLPSISPSLILPPTNLHRPNHHPKISFPIRKPFIYLEPSRNIRINGPDSSSCGCSGNQGGGETESEDLERAIHLDGSIPGTSDEFVRRVSSRAYDMRRHAQQSLDSTSYDVLEANPWRESSKPVYVLTQKQNQLCTMKTRMNRSEVETELGKLFSRGRGSGFGNKAGQFSGGTQFRMIVEDVREGVLVFEDQDDAAKYCDLLQGGGKGCDGVAEIEASSVFDICQKMRALAVIFRRGGTPPLPESLELNLKAKKRSLEDQDELI
ncbi:hypothetical protein ACHQM5_008953 [Ranunculus cassubicifolius]